ncbi:hypothetical protein NEAUS04_2031 [Nematocida ausubeli]|nr:hypothetical protein NEAUS04_2031 [Nematocida ausubeli]
MKLSQQGDSKTVIGISEREFFKALVDENGFYPKDKEVSIEEIETYADITMKGCKNGSTVIVSIILTENSQSIDACRISLNKEVSAYVSVDVLVDSGSAQEIVQSCLADVQRKLTQPNLVQLFKNRQTVSHNIYRAGSRAVNRKIVSYGVIGEKYITSPILQEFGASDAVLTITSEDERIIEVEIEKGCISPGMLARIMQDHMN